MGWSHHKPIAVSAANVDANLTDFPLLVDVSADGDLAKARADGYDVRFTLDDGVTQLKYDRLAWSGGGGSAATAKWWVKLPSINLSGGASIQMHYGNPSAGDGQDRAATFADPEAVLHLNDASGPMADATGNGHVATIAQGTQQASGVIQTGRETTANGDRLLIADHAAMEGLNELAADCWVRFNGLTTYDTYPIVWAKQDFAKLGVRLNGATGKIQFNVNADAISHGTSIAVDTWYHIVASWKRNDAGGHKLLVNGVEATPESTSDVASPSDTYAYSLLCRYWNSRAIDGRMEEWRFWPTADPCGNVEAYAKFVHANVTSGDNELTIGAEVAHGHPFFRRYILGV